MASWPLLQNGSSGEAVKTVQYLLDAHGAGLTADGSFGPLTTAAVKTFQQAHGLAVDGIVGNQTWGALLVTVSSGASGPAVRAVQSQISSRAFPIAIDGAFGPETDSAARFFQGDVGLTVDGIVGANTWNRLVDGYIASPDGVSAAQSMFAAWSHSDQAEAARYATPSAVANLFGHPYVAGDHWTYAGSNGAAGHMASEWTGAPGTLVLVANNSTGAPYFFVESVVYP